MAGNGKTDQCHRELVEDKGPRERGTIIFFLNSCHLDARNR